MSHLRIDVTTPIDVSELIVVEPTGRTVPIERSQILMSQPLPVVGVSPRGWLGRLWDSLTRRRV